MGVNIEPVELTDEAIFNPFVIEDEVKEENEELNLDDFVPVINIDDSVVAETEEIGLEEYLNNIGLDYLDFSSQDLDELNNNFDKDWRI